MEDMNGLNCWVVTSGKAGMENQCIGLAEALGMNPVIKRILLRPPWRQFVPHLRIGLRFAFSPASDVLSPPWPDILIACGRPSSAACLLVRRESARNNGSRTFTVYIQNPCIDPSHFDVMVVPEHDRLTGENIIVTRGGLHRVTPELMAREAQALAPLVGHLPRPLVGVLIGGPDRNYRFSPREMRPLAASLKRFAERYGAGLIVTPSRRTGQDNMAALQEGLRGAEAYLWDGTGHNPYYGILGLADMFVVTADSINLTSEACTTGKPVFVADLPGGTAKFDRFHQKLREDGLTRPFTGTMELWSYTPLDDLQKTAREIKARFLATK